jgi:hypothetical protein
MIGISSTSEKPIVPVHMIGYYHCLFYPILALDSFRFWQNVSGSFSSGLRRLLRSRKKEKCSNGCSNAAISFLIALLWWTAAGTFTDEEQAQWEQSQATPAGETTRASLAALMSRSRQHELEAAWAEQRPPRFHYPALALDDVRARLAALSHLRETIFQREPDELISYLYAGAIDEAMQDLQLLQATAESDSVAFREGQQRRYRAPSAEEMCFALFRLRRLIQQGLE